MIPPSTNMRTDLLCQGSLAAILVENEAGNYLCPGVTLITITHHHRKHKGITFLDTQATSPMMISTINEISFYLMEIYDKLNDGQAQLIWFHSL